MFICGNGSFANQDEEHEINEGFNSPRAKRSKRTTSFCKIIGRDSSNKNPYANRGLDKFYALLADLDSRKQKIYTQMGPEEISFVRFVYANDSDRVKPIVVKVKDQKKPEKTLTVKNSFANPAATAAAMAPDQTTSSAPTTQVDELKEQKKKMKRYNLRCGASFKLDNLRRPVYFFAAIMVLILVFLAVFGRSFAILCTSIGWYLVPMVGSSSSSSSSLSSTSSDRKLKRKKDYVRNQSDKKISHLSSTGPSSPTSVVNGGHGRSS